MKCRIEWRDLMIMGLSEKALDLYSNTDPLNIYKTSNGFKVTGAFEFSCETEAALIEFLEDVTEMCLEECQ